MEALRAVTEKNSAVSTWDQAGKVQHRSSSLPFHTHGVLEGLRADGTTAPLVSLQPLCSHFFKSGVMLPILCTVQWYKKKHIHTRKKRNESYYREANIISMLYVLREFFIDTT